MRSAAAIKSSLTPILIFLPSISTVASPCVEVHLTAPFRILRAATEFIRNAAKTEAAEGRDVFRKVVNISSISGICGNAGQVNYAAAKAGIVGATKALSKEWGRYIIDCHCSSLIF